MDAAPSATRFALGAIGMVLIASVAFIILVVHIGA